MEEASSVSIFSYMNYREFLLDRYREKKRTQYGWSLRNWASQLGIGSHSMLTMILNGSRNPGPSLTEGLCRTLTLPPNESAFLIDLIELQKAEGDERKKQLILERLAQRVPKGGVIHLDRESFGAISRWHYYAIREMVRLKSFREDAEWMAKRLKFEISASEIRHAIRMLLKLGLLTRGADGKLQQARGHSETSFDIANEGIKRFHEQALDNARESVRKQAPAHREICGTTLGISRKQLPRAKALVRKFHREFFNLMEDGDCDAVYQLQTSFYPLATEEEQ